MRPHSLPNVAITTWNFWSDPQLYKQGIKRFDEFIMAIPIDSVGINAGGGITGGFLKHFGPKGGLATAILIDGEGNLAIIATREIGIGVTEKSVSANLFVNAVVGINGAMCKDYAGKALSISGTAGPVSMAYTVPSDDNPGGRKSFVELGFVPGPTSLGGKFEGGMTVSRGEGFILRNPFYETGKWWGNFFYDLLH